VRPRRGERSAQAQDVIDYCEAWYEAVGALGYIPGLYVGAETLLNGSQLCDQTWEGTKLLLVC
jgi:hypothetical protein